MTIVAWPVVSRHHVVHAYKPGERSAAEGPYRTLRMHEWATSGVRLARRAGGRLAGQMTVFSSLNVESARLARHGDLGAAARVAWAAAQVEAGSEFARLIRVLADLPGGDAEQVIDGVLPDGAPAALEEALRAVARRTERLRAGESVLATLAEVVAGRIAEVHEDHVLLVRLSGPATMIPRWMAVAARRDSVGELLVLVLDRVGSTSALVEAVPAIDVDDKVDDKVDDEVDGSAFSPFGRGDARVRALSRSDERLLTGEPQPLRILVPVTIGI